MIKLSYQLLIYDFCMKKELTLAVITQDDRILLGMKKRGFGEGKWNGFGGKVMAGETIEDAARREVREEAGIEVIDLKKSGLIDFEFKGNPEILEVHIFYANDFHGQITESDEMKPQWYQIDEIPFDLMWADDRHWMPLLLAGKKFRGKFLFDGMDTIVQHELSEVEEL